MKIAKEFKEFITKGNVMDMAIGVIIGGAFGKIVASLVDDILMPLIGLILGGQNFAGLSVKVGKAVVGYGAFIQNIVDFLIIALCIFLMMKGVNTIRERAAKKKEEEEKEEEPVKSDEVVLLEEIRDLLKNK